MRPLVKAAIIASLAVPAFAQEGDPKAEANKAEQQKKKESDEPKNQPILVMKAAEAGCDVMTPNRSIARWNGASLSSGECAIYYNTRRTCQHSAQVRRAYNRPRRALRSGREGPSAGPGAGDTRSKPRPEP
jgi:hypothetical protein